MNQKDKMEALLLQCEKDLGMLQDFHKKVAEIEANRRKLESYYQGDYISDYDAQREWDTPYRILDQDSIWNVLQDQYQEKLELSKKLISSL